MKANHLLVLGGGLVGSLLATTLARRGYRVTIFERRADPRREGGEEGRSINLALSDRGWRALAHAGADAGVREIAIPMRGRMMHAPDGALTFQPYGRDGQAIYSVSRRRLNQLLLDHAEAAGARCCFEWRCEEVDLKNTTVRVRHQVTEDIATHHADGLLGADGAFSAVRSVMQRTDRFNYQQHYLPHGYKELTIPPRADGGWAMEPHALHIWPRQAFMLIALPNPDGSFTCTLFVPFETEQAHVSAFAQLDNPTAVQHFFDENFSDVVPLMPDLMGEFFRNPTASMVTTRCYPWVHHHTALVGDAAHAIVPFYGQGMNAGFEDCYELDRLLAEHQGHWTAALHAYQAARKPNADAIADLALQNFVEMRDRVADPDFLLRKKIEARLHARAPERWLPLYTMVTFSELPYAEALRRGRAQESFMNDVMAAPDTAHQWQDDAWLDALLVRAEAQGLLAMPEAAALGK